MTETRTVVAGERLEKGDMVYIANDGLAYVQVRAKAPWVEFVRRQLLLAYYSRIFSQS